MNRSIFKRMFLVPVLAAGFVGSDLYAAEISAPAPVLKHVSGNGNIAQALLFQLQNPSLGVTSHDHLIFIDTSASQIGAHRLHAMAVLESLLKSLPETDRVQVFAVDVQAEPLMASLASPNSDSVRSSLAALKTRIPLGATNFHAIMQTALKSADSNGHKSITYIGDGLSTADLLESKELRGIVAQLRTQKTPFHSYGVGPQINLQLLGVMAHQTGGYVDFDSRKDVGREGTGQTQLATEAGQKLGQAIQQPVFFPSQVTMTSNDVSSLPLLPLRTDRETIHIVRGTIAADARVKFIADNASETLEWRLSAPLEQPGSAFLAAVADQVEKDQGLSNSLAGRGLMQVYQGSFIDSMEGALQYGDQQLARGQIEQAAEIARRVAEVDPGNRTAKSLASSSDRLRVMQVSQVTPAAPEPDGELESRTQPNANSSLTRDQEQAIRVKTEKLRNQVSNAIDGSRKTDDPESGLAQLKQVENSVRSSIDIAPEDRLQMQKRLESEINQMKNLSDKRAQDKVHLAEELSQLEAQKRLTEQLQLDEERLEGLIDRVRSLMSEGFHGREDAFAEAQNVADVAINLRPGEGTSAAARFDAEAAHQLARSNRLRARRNDQFLEALYQVELAHIPFPDEPPIRFPNAEVWKALTERRRKWATVDLRKESPNEQRIQQALKDTTEVQFTDQPLKDALEYLEDLHKIEIWIDAPALADAGISTDQNVNLVMSGITLRSALRLLLEPLQLTYVIEDEVMKITTQEKADEKMSTRVYPVADLVIRIQSGAGGGGMGGGMGGGGMMGGGMGGGGMGGGMGGGGMGMGGGGFGGGGFFSIPPEQVKPKANNAEEAKPADGPKLDNATIKNLKKKRNK